MISTLVLPTLQSLMLSGLAAAAPTVPGDAASIADEAAVPAAVPTLTLAATLGLQVPPQPAPTCAQVMAKIQSLEAEIAQIEIQTKLLSTLATAMYGPCQMGVEGACQFIIDSLAQISALNTDKKAKEDAIKQLLALALAIC